MKKAIITVLLSGVLCFFVSIPVLAEEQGMTGEDFEPGEFGDDDIDMDIDLGGGHSGMHTAGGMDDFDFDTGEEETSNDTGTEDLGGEEAGSTLPSPDELGVGDFTDNNIEF